MKNKAPAAPVLRALTPTDYDAVFALWQASEGMGLNESDTRDAITSYLVRNPGLSLVAEVENKIAGAVLCGHDGRRGYLHHLAVAGLAAPSLTSPSHGFARRASPSAIFSSMPSTPPAVHSGSTKAGSRARIWS
ncbi:MAG TPA: hypothetical protein VNW23_06825 [Opitutaceae bacterium]|nr:hypothetical protein [Opitutaceae bacterium]